MKDEEQVVSRRKIWLWWVFLTTLGALSGYRLFLLLYEDWFTKTTYSVVNAVLSTLILWVHLGFPLFFASLGQWLILREKVVLAQRWLLTGALGALFSLPYLFLYAFLAEQTQNQSLIFGTEWFWYATGILTLLSFIFGSVVGGFQGWFILRNNRGRRGRILLWVGTNALAWGAGFPLGLQFLASRIQPGHPLYDSWIASVLMYGTPWLFIGIVTGAVFLWIRDPKAGADEANPRW